MDYATTTTPIEANPAIRATYLSPIDDLMDRYEQILQKHRADNPDLYRLVDLQKQREKNTAEAKVQTKIQAAVFSATTATKSNASHIETGILPLWVTELRGAPLRVRIQKSHREIREQLLPFNAGINPRTQAHNRKCGYQTIEEEREFRADALAAQIKAWRSMLPSLFRKFARIPDYRRPGSIEHRMTVLMVFGLFAFIFRLSSRREMNRELTSPVVFNHLQKLFPDIDSIPHADTLARVLEHMDPKSIEKIHISLIKELIKKKKFKKLLVLGCVPISIDGSQKLYRQGLLRDRLWCEREVGNNDPKDKQQYIYVLEANITLQNGLNIPLMTEYLYRSNNKLERDDGKQDSETTAFERLAKRLKKYFPRLKIMLLMDAMFATQPVMEIAHNNRWEYIIRLPQRKLTDFAKIINAQKESRISLPNQSHYRNRKQSFYWENDIIYGYEWQLTLSLVVCFEEYYGVNQKTGEIENRYSEHIWISSIPANESNLHELLNLGARKQGLIEDSFNTEKNRGYHYKHAFSYNWNAMRGFHHLMRLAHTINAISEFTKIIKKYVKALGCSATLKLIKETLFSTWLGSVAKNIYFQKSYARALFGRN